MNELKSKNENSTKSNFPLRDCLGRRADAQIQEYLPAFTAH